jgi:ParB family chromosome partitioning protein
MNMAAKKRGLGRGLDALLGPAGSQAPTSPSEPEADPDGAVLKQIPIEWIRPGQFQPRQTFDAEKLQELAASIRVHGVMQPILLREVASEQFELIAGERRWRACQLAGLDRVPALIKALTPQNHLALSLIENIQREDLNPLEEAQALSRLVEEFGLTHQAVGDAVGKSRAAVSNAIRLSKLGSVASELLARGDIEMGHARALLPLDAEVQALVARQIVSKNLTVRQTEKLAQQQLAPKAEPLKPQKTDPDVVRLEQQLSDYFGQSVRLKKKGARRGQMLIDYNSFEELDGVLLKAGFKISADGESL